MGVSISVHRNGSNDKEQYQQQLSREAKEKLLKERGVLIPPAFGVSSVAVGGTTGHNKNSSINAVSPSVQDQDSSSFYPSPWQRLCRMDPSYGLLYDYMQPGLWAKTGDDAGNVSVLASLTTTTSSGPTGGATESPNDKAATTAPAVVLGRIVGERYWFDRQIMTSIRGGSNDGATSLATKLEVSPGLSIWASGNLNGEGWLSSNLNYTYSNNNNNDASSSSPSNNSAPTKAPTRRTSGGGEDDVHLELISWIPFSNKNNNTSSTTSSRVLGDLHTFGALRVANRLTAATEAQVSLDVLEVSNVKSYCSVDLLGSGSSSSSSSSSETDSLSPPPLQLTLERSSPTTSALCLSQVVCFDRLQFNPLEDRAPYVRNTAAWTIRLENTMTTTAENGSKNSHVNNPHHDAFSTMTDDYNMNTDHAGSAMSSSSVTSTTDIAVGAAWQINRALAVKAVIRPTQKSITGALLLKRWQQPRLTCSILGRYSWHTHQTSFLGVGLELETTTTTTTTRTKNGQHRSNSNSSDNNNDQYYYYPTSTRPTGIKAPETKATLP